MRKSLQPRDRWRNMTSKPLGLFVKKWLPKFGLEGKRKIRKGAKNGQWTETSASEVPLTVFGPFYFWPFSIFGPFLFSTFLFSALFIFGPLTLGPMIFGPAYPIRREVIFFSNSRISNYRSVFGWKTGFSVYGRISIGWIAFGRISISRVSIGRMGGAEWTFTCVRSWTAPKHLWLHKCLHIDVGSLFLKGT